MQPSVSKGLKKATEVLRDKMLIAQTIEAQLMNLKTKFVSETDPSKKEKLKTLLIAKNKEYKTAEAAVQAADAVFHRMLAREPEEDVYDLLDHNTQEHLVRLRVRKIVKEVVSSLKNSK